MPVFHDKLKRAFTGRPPDVLTKPARSRPTGWREALLAKYNPLSPAAFLIRNEPLSSEERKAVMAEFALLQRQLEGLPNELEAEPVSAVGIGALSALAELSFDIDAECTAACAILERPHELIGAGLGRAHFFDPCLGELFAVSEALYAKHGVLRPYSRMPDALPVDSWWRVNWEGEGRQIFLALLERYWEGDAREAACAIIELARGRGVA